MKPAIEIVDVELDYAGGPVLRGVSLTVAAGEIVTVAGPSGSGKSTLLRVILGLAAPRRGVVRLAGVDASKDGRILVPPEERHLAVVFQDLALWPHLTVAGNLEFVLSARRLERARRRRRIADLLGQVGLGDKAKALPGELSGGEQQRLAIARALAQEPKALLLDEPLSSIDVDLREELIELFSSLLAAKRLTTLLVTHDPREATALGQRIVILESGKVVASGTVDDLAVAPATSFIRAFLAALGRGSE